MEDIHFLIISVLFENLKCRSDTVLRAKHSEVAEVGSLLALV